MSSELILSIALRSFAPPVICLVVLLVWRKASASTRRLVWLFCFVSLLALPLAILRLPPRELVRYQQANPAPKLTGPKVRSGKIGSVVLPVLGTQALGGSAVYGGPVLTEIYKLKPSINNFSSLGWLVPILWLGGVLVASARWFLGLIRLVRLRLEPVQDADLLADTATVCRRLGLKPPPRLAFCEQVRAPMVFGMAPARLVLPGAAKGWELESRRAMLIHECAHVRHGDWLVLLFAQFVAAVYWFNPMVWVAARQLRAECESAADDAVLLCGVAPTNYAGELLRIAVDLRPISMAGSVAILERGALRPRIEKLLETSRSRGPASPLIFALALVLSCGLVLCLGATYRTITGPVVSHDGFADLGNGRHLRIIAIVRRTAHGTESWNMRGEVLPESMPLPENIESWMRSSAQRTPIGPDARYVVLAQNFQGDGIETIEDSEKQPLAAALPLQSITSTKAGYGFEVSRLDGDSMSVVGINNEGGKFTSIQCGAPAGELSTIDEMRPNGASTMSHSGPVQWSLSELVEEERRDGRGGVMTAHGSAVDPARLGYRSHEVRSSQFEVTVPDEWVGKEIFIRIKSRSASVRLMVKSESGEQKVVQYGLDPRTITGVSLEIRDHRDVLFDQVPLNPSGGVAQTPDFDVDSLREARSGVAPGTLLGIADPDHPEWGYWRPDGTPMPPIQGVHVPVRDRSMLPAGHDSRPISLLFSSRKHGEGLAVADVSGVLICSSIEFDYVPSGVYQKTTVYTGSSATTLPLFVRNPEPDTMVAHVTLTRMSPSEVTSETASFFSNKVDGSSLTYYRFPSPFKSSSDVGARSLDFYYSNGPAPSGSWTSFMTDWDDGLVAIATKHPEKFVSADVMAHPYDYVRYPSVALYPLERR